MQVRSLVRELRSTCHGATKPISSRVDEMQLEKPKSQSNKEPTHCKTQHSSIDNVFFKKERGSKGAQNLRRDFPNQEQMVTHRSDKHKGLAVGTSPDTKGHFASEVMSFGSHFWGQGMLPIDYGLPVLNCISACYSWINSSFFWQFWSCPSLPLYLSQ